MSKKPQPEPSKIVGTIGDPPEPVTPENPLSGLEIDVLRNWLENSPPLQKRYVASPANRSNLENAARLAVRAAWEQEMQLRANGLTLDQAREHTRPPMWTPPTWNQIATLPPPSPEAPPLAASPSTTPPPSPAGDGPPSSTTTLPPSDS